MKNTIEITDEKIKEDIIQNKALGADNPKDLEKKVNIARRSIICSKMWIDACCVDERGEFSYVIKFINICGEEIELIVPRGDFTQSHIGKLLRVNGGYSFDDRMMFDFLKQYENYALGYAKPVNEGLVVKPIVMKRTYSKAGWCMLKNGNVGFVSEKGCYTQKKYQANSEYVGRLRIKQAGKLCTYKKMIQTYIIDKGNIALQAILAMAGASVLLWYFNNVYHKQILNFLVHLGGDKGTGKSTSLELCASFSGNPSKKVDSNCIPIYSTFHSTENALTDLDFNNGNAVAIDDTQLCDNKLKDSTFYELALAQGSEWIL